MALKLTGWQRLWILATVLWAAPVGLFAYSTRPQPVTFAGCEFPAGVGADEVMKLVRDQVLERGGTTAGPTLTPEEVLDALPTKPVVILPPEAKGRNLCHYLKEQFERSGREGKLRSESIHAYAHWSGIALAFWLGPALLVYALGLAVAWVIHGFRNR